MYDLKPIISGRVVVAVDLARLEQLIAESEQRITEQVLRIMAAEAAGRDTARLHRLLKTFEGILVEMHHARDLALAKTRLLAGDGPSVA